MRHLGFLFIIFVPLWSWSYPEFIGYGYSSCLTCHYNGQGNGPINDYGRAVWSAEIAGRTFAGKKTDEELAASSGFLGSTKLPWWLRPGIKARYARVQSAPFTGGDNNFVSSNPNLRNIWMQAEANLAILFDKKSDLIFVGSMGYAPDPFRFRGGGAADSDNLISREHYVRWHQSKNLWLYVGMLDKVFGIRTVNHTAYSRARTGFAQNDQSHSVIAHYIKDSWELTADLFMGNMYQDSDLRQKGASLMYEYEIKQNWRLGTSILASSNSYIKNERFAVHSKAGLNDGASILFELGLIRNTPDSADLQQGYYVYSQGMQRLVRGFHIFVAGQAYKDDLKEGKTDLVKMGSGIVYFPRGRYELRIEAENTRRFSTDNVSADTWTLQGQLHLSL